MSQECVVGVYNSLKQAEQAVHVLHRAGFPTKQISLVASKLSDKPALAAELKLGDDSVRDAAIGAGLGGVVGLLTGLGFLAVTGLGVIFVLGPLAMAVTGMTVGAFLGSFIGWGVHESHAEHYQQCLENGKSLVFAHGNPLELAHAERILKETDVAEVRVHARTSDDAPEIMEN